MTSSDIDNSTLYLDKKYEQSDVDMQREGSDISEDSDDNDNELYVTEEEIESSSPTTESGMKFFYRIPPPPFPAHFDW